jgi:phosphopantothenate synthetase
LIQGERFVRLIVFAMLLIAISPVLSGCGETLTPTPFTQTTDSLSAMLTVDPFPPTPMGETTLQLTLRDAGGQPVSGANVRFDLTMPGMEMPPNRPEATDEGNGVYRAQAIFTMAGEWEIQAEISRPGESQQFIFNLKTK